MGRKHAITKTRPSKSSDDDPIELWPGWQKDARRDLGASGVAMLRRWIKLKVTRAEIQRLENMRGGSLWFRRAL
jgi:hypothetical protein